MKKTAKNTGIGMALGMCFGMCFGSAMKGLGISMGLCFGMLIGLVIGAGKNKIVNAQVEEKEYKIKVIEKDGLSDQYRITLTDHSGKIQTVSVSSGTMETELFTVGDIVFMDEDGEIEQAFDKEDE